MGQPLESQQVTELLHTLLAPCCGECRFRVKCSTEQLCCARFSMWAAGEGEPRWRLAPCAPSRARYEALFLHTADGDEVLLRLHKAIARAQGLLPVRE